MVMRYVVLPSIITRRGWSGWWGVCRPPHTHTLTHTPHLSLSDSKEPCEQGVVLGCRSEMDCFVAFCCCWWCLSINAGGGGGGKREDTWCKVIHQYRCFQTFAKRRQGILLPWLFVVEHSQSFEAELEKSLETKLFFRVFFSSTWNQ